MMSEFGLLAARVNMVVKILSIAEFLQSERRTDIRVLTRYTFLQVVLNPHSKRARQLSNISKGWLIFI